MILNNHDLWLKCAEWGSYINASDPGACMYGLNGAASFQHPEHARQVIFHIETRCMQHASDEDREDLNDILDTARDFLT